MENLLDSNERTLVIFDAVCQGLNECLGLVHWDIGHMTEHRNSLAIIEQDRIRAKLIAPRDLINSSSASGSSSQSSSPFKPQQQQKQQVHGTTNDYGLYEATSFKTTTKPKSKNDSHGLRNKSSSTTNIDSSLSELPSRCGQTRAESHRMSGIDLLDKRLAESFSQAFDLSDDLKSKVKGQSTKPSIFQVLFGKYSSKFSNRSMNNNNNSNDQNANNTQGDLESDGEPDYKLVIDDINRQIRLAMQYSKQLEAHLFKIEDLRARFEMHLKMGLVVRDVARAYISGDQSPSSDKRHRNHLQHQQQPYVINDYSSIGTHSSQSSSNLSIWSTGSRSRGTNQQHGRRPSLAEVSGFSKGALTCQANGGGCYRKSSSALNQQNPSSGGSCSHSNGSSSNSKTTIKEFIENIDKIEAEFESYMGTLLFTIEDIQGFARVCQGDVFEISIRYGDADKFKTRISVLKDNRQKCDSRQIVFKARIADPLAIKAYECKGLGKRVLLGHKLCETRDLFTARSQVMTISLNQTGSIKLNLIVTWNPLHLAPNASSSGLDITHISLPPKQGNNKTGSGLLKTSSSTASIPNQYSQTHPWMMNASQSQRM